jgi:hypothetical protein
MAETCAFTPGKVVKGIQSVTKNNVSISRYSGQWKFIVIRFRYCKSCEYFGILNISRRNGY